VRRCCQRTRTPSRGARARLVAFSRGITIGSSGLSCPRRRRVRSHAVGQQLDGCSRDTRRIRDRSRASTRGDGQRAPPPPPPPEENPNPEEPKPLAPAPRTRRRTNQRPSRAAGKILAQDRIPTRRGSHGKRSSRQRRKTIRRVTLTRTSKTAVRNLNAASAAPRRPRVASPVRRPAAADLAWSAVAPGGTEWHCPFPPEADRSDDFSARAGRGDRSPDGAARRAVVGDPGHDSTCGAPVRDATALRARAKSRRALGRATMPPINITFERTASGRLEPVSAKRAS